MISKFSKSQFIKGIQCHKYLWLYKYKPELRTPPDAFQQAIFDASTEIGRYAHGLFPGGVEITYEGSSIDQKLRLTQDLISDGAETIYEATFDYDEIVVMVDILHKGPSGWEIYEVKGSTSPDKEPYLQDVSVQYYVVSGSGLSVSKAFLVHLNREYVRSGDINIHELFIMRDFTDEVRDHQDHVVEELSSMRDMLRKECPEIDIGSQCSAPYDCGFRDYCWEHIPDNSVFDLKERGINKFEYYYKGIIRFKDFDLDDLNYKQKMQVEAELYDKPVIDVTGIKQFLDMLNYPQYFLDFETFMPAIPQFNGTRPYQPVPFQYSMHVIENDASELKHYEYLADAGIDPREKIARDLTQLIPENACVIAYNSSYEKGRIKELAEQFREYSEKLLRINENMIDLMIPFKRRHYYTKEMRGSYSIKAVLPALVPELRYEGLAISGGNEAMSVYSTLHLIEDKSEVEKIRKDLLKYCRLDTLGMVKLTEKLKEVCSNS
jgi:hypothetical protein